MEPTEVVGGSLYRLGGVVPIDGRLSWRAPGVRGYEPLSCYLLLADSTALLVGTGVRLHEQLIVDQIRGLIGNRTLAIFADRNEADQIGNLARIVTEFDVRRIWFAGAGHLLRWFEHDGFDGRLPSETSIVFMMPPGLSRSIDLESDRPSVVDFDGDRLELLHTRLTTLGFAWLYDKETGTLFSSDFFSEVPMATGDSPILSRADAVTLDEVQRHIHARFYWTRDAATAPLLDNLDELVGARPVERFCPYHGCVIEGADAVRRHLDLARHALGGNPNRTPVPA